jgi:hypothetical protein
MDTVHLANEERLAALGYKQEFQREFTSLEVRVLSIVVLVRKSRAN